MTLARAALGLALGVLMVAGAACGGNANAVGGRDGSGVRAIPDDLVPGELMGLTVTAEDMSETIAGTERTYLDGVGLFALREKDLVKATLQVSRFNDDADYDNNGFRRALVNQIGGTNPRLVRLGDDSIFLTTGTKQRIFVWFEDAYMFVLAVRDDFDRPRGLLRASLAVKP
jgi:hypothetical protein